MEGPEARRFNPISSAATLSKSFHHLARRLSKALQGTLMVLLSSRIVWKDFEGLIDIFVSFLVVASHLLNAAKPIPSAGVPRPFI